MNIYELIYTSASNTLDGPGYGAVAKTKAIPPALERHMRSLSWYDFLNKESLPAGSSPPEIHSHSLFPGADSRWHVFSRIAHAGLDYTKRSVFIAHHFAVRSDDLKNVSPFELVATAELFRKEWKGQPELLALRSIVLKSEGSRMQGFWSRISGGTSGPECWQNFGRTNAGPLFLLSRSVNDNLRLFFEAGQAVQESRRNEISFITGIGADHRGTKYDWVGLIDGTEIANSIRTSSPDRVFNTLDMSFFSRYAKAVDLPTKSLQRENLVPAPPAWDADDMSDELFQAVQEDVYPSVRSPGQAAIERRKIPQPPPPPPARIQPRMAWGLFACTAIILGFVLVAVRQWSKSPTVVAQSVSLGSENVPDSTADNAQKKNDGAIAKTGIEPPDRDDQSPPLNTRKTPIIPVSPGVVPGPLSVKTIQSGDFFIRKGISELWKQDTSTDWVFIGQLPPGGKLASMTLLGARPLGFSATSKKELELVVVDTQTSVTVAKFKCVNYEVQIQVPLAARDSEALRRLRSCCLQFKGLGFDQYRLALNSEQESLTTQNVWKSNHDVSELFHGLGYPLLNGCSLKFRLETISVPMFTGPLNAEIAEDTKKLDEVKPTTYSAITTLRDHPVEVSVVVETFFDRNASKADPPLKLTVPLNGNTSSAPPQTETDKETDKEKEKAQPLKDRKKNGSEKFKDPDSETTGESKKSEDIVEDKPISDEDLLKQLLSRFGSVTGSLLMSISDDGQKPIEYPILRFGSKTLIRDPQP